MMFSEKRMTFEQLFLNHDYTDTTLRAVTGDTSVPQISINGEKIGGSDKL